MNRLLRYSVGADISKDKFDACISAIDDLQQVTIKASRTFKNNPEGFEDFLTWVKRHYKQGLPISYIMEATGVYYEKLAIFLTNNKCYVSVVLPGKSKHYIKSIGLKTKNDKIDAKGLSRMGAEQRLDQWKPYSKSIYRLRSLTRQNESLNKQKSIYANQLHAIEHSGYVNKTVVRQLKQFLKLIDKQLAEVAQEIEKTINQDIDIRDKVKKICKVKGLGILTVATVIAETNGFILFKNQRQLVSYAGYDVIENTSGNHIGKTKISKKGNSHIRRVLHMPAFSVVKYEPHYKRLYERVFDRTRIKMKGYVAVQKKLVVLIYTLWKNNTEYDLHYKKTSGNDEPKLLFSLGFEKAAKKVVPAQCARTTQDELPRKESPEVLFSL
jgi:transposase